jgi:hypothetical protein
MPRLTRPGGTARINLAIAPTTRELLDALQRRTGAASLEEVVRRSLAYYDALVRIEEEGGRVEVTPKRGQKQLLRLLP